MKRRLKIPIISITNPHSEVSEHYRTLRTNIEFLRSTDNLSTLVVTSGVPGAGKSLTCANLAVMIGQSEASIVLVDADLRNPRQHQLFDINNSMGLTNLISREGRIDDYLVDGPETIKILPAGPIPPNPAEILDSRAAETIFSKLKEQFQVVIVDAPPILPFTDPLVLSRYASAVLYVVRAGFNSRRADLRAMEMLTRSGIKVAGVILNSVTHERSRNYSGYYYER